jgi:voltage-gated potassium channel
LIVYSWKYSSHHKESDDTRGIFVLGRILEHIDGMRKNLPKNLNNEKRFKIMRKKIYELVEVTDSGSVSGKIYDCFMLISILVSVVPLAFKEQTTLFLFIDKITAAIFIFDYILRLITADYKVSKGRSSFIIYPFTPLAIIDLISILPAITLLNKGFKLLRIFRLLRTLKIFKAVRYSKNIIMIVNVFKAQKKALLSVCWIAIAYILISALLILNVEPQTFDNYFDAVYWATISLTTVGYGDIYPVSVVGRIITMFSSAFGIAIIALPSGIITAGILDELQKNK